ncbi:unnamed protein product [Somion occarium]|uniref:MYND-type domain-containing protein n=1 Tax=Somion occarium TaxID=3059160 RepID=A0ABP1CLP6_9APHY
MQTSQPNQPVLLEYIQRGDKISCNEQQYKAAIATREFLLGPSDPATAKCYNGLGDLYIKLGRLEEAEEYLSRALQVRSSGPLFDAAVTRDNLGCIYEMKGDIQKAREMRITDEHVICGLYECASQRLYRLNEISRCSKCKCIFYCSAQCQRNDWPRHKAYCKSTGVI